MEGVAHAALSGDHLRVIAASTIDETVLERRLEQAGVEVAAISKGEASLEDVFLNLARN